MWNLKEIQKLANKQSKKKGHLGYFQNFNAGNVPLGVSIFNSNMDTGNDPAENVSSIGTADGGVGMVGDAMGEELEKTEGAGEMPEKFKSHLKAINNKNNAHRRKNVKSRIKEALDKTVFTDELLNKVKKEIESGKRSDSTFDIIEEVASEGIQDFFGDVDVEANVQFGRGDYRVYDDKGGYRSWDAEEDEEALDDAILNASTWDDAVADYVDFLDSAVMYHEPNYDESVKNVKVKTFSDIEEAEDDYIPDPEFTKLGFEGIYDYDPEVKITDYEMPFGEDYSEKDYEDTWQYRYEKVGSKRVRSGDGIETDYTIYYDNENNNYIAIFGDEKYFNPSNTKYWDVFNSKEEALNYLNNCDNNNSEQNKNICIPVTVNKKIKSPYDVIDEDFIYDDQVDDYENHNYPSKKESTTSLEYNDDAINSEETPYGYGEREEQIKKAERNIISLKAELRFLTFVAPMELKRGGAFDSKEEIDDAKEQVLKALEKEESRLAALKRR